MIPLFPGSIHVGSCASVVNLIFVETDHALGQGLSHRRRGLLVCRPVLPASAVCVSRDGRGPDQPRSLRHHGAKTLQWDSNPCCAGDDTAGWLAHLIQPVLLHVLGLDAHKTGAGTTLVCLPSGLSSLSDGTA